MKVIHSELYFLYPGKCNFPDTSVDFPITRIIAILSAAHVPKTDDSELLKTPEILKNQVVATLLGNRGKQLGVRITR